MKEIIDIVQFVWSIVSSKDFSVMASFFLTAINCFLLYVAYITITNMKCMNDRKEQSMNEVERTITAMTAKMWSAYLTLAKRKLGDEYMHKIETKLYRHLLMCGFVERKDAMRYRVRKNGFEYKKPEEWSKYVRNAIEEDMQGFTSYLDQNYHPHSIISREDVFKVNQTVMTELRSLGQLLYDELLNLAKKSEMKKFLFWRLVV